MWHPMRSQWNSRQEGPFCGFHCVSAHCDLLQLIHLSFFGCSCFRSHTLCDTKHIFFWTELWMSIKHVPGQVLCFLFFFNPSTQECFSSSSPSPPALPVLSVFILSSALFRSLLIFRGWAAMRIYAEMLTLCVGCKGNYPCIFYTFSALWNPNKVTFPGIETNQKAK